MKPLLFEGTWYEIPVYFAIYMLAFLGAILFASRRARKFGLSPVMAIDAGMMSFVGGFLGARLFHILFEYPQYYWDNPGKILQFWNGGFVLYGGLIGGVIVVCSFLKLKKQSLLQWGDFGAPSMLLGIGIGRMACLANGCCYGKPTDLFWGMVFTDSHSAAPLHIALHPTQLLESLFGFVFFGIFFLIWKKPRARPGYGLAWLAICYGVFRFLIEYVRDDPERGFWFKNFLSTSQIVSVLTICFSIVYMIWLSAAYRSGKYSTSENS